MDKTTDEILFDDNSKLIYLNTCENSDSQLKCLSAHVFQGCKKCSILQFLDHGKREENFKKF